MTPDTHSLAEASQHSSLLDTAPEERFDRLTRMARRVFNVPIAFISLADSNRHWFKSRFGIEATEVDLSIPVLGDIVESGKPYVVPNTQEDTRFLKHELVVGESNIRFYAGVPLRCEGETVGTLSIVDSIARLFRDEDMELLKDIGRMIENELAQIQEVTMDDLTGISNRRGFYLIAEHSLSLNIRYRNDATVALLRAVLPERSDSSNDKDKEETILCAFGQLLQQFFRDSDLVGRLDSDQFAVLLQNTSIAGAQRVLDKLSVEVEHFCRKHSPELPVEFESGLAAFTAERPRTVHKLVEEAGQDLEMLSVSV